MVLAEPRGRVSVLLQDRADGAFVDRDDRVVAGKPCRHFAHHPEAHRVMVAAGDDRRPRRRAERGGVEIRVAQPLRGDTVERRGRNHAAKRARRAEAGIVGHDEQHVGRALRRHDARRPPGRRLRGLLLDHPAEIRFGRRKLFSVDRGGGAGRTWDTCNLLSQCRDATKGEKTCARKHAATDFHGGKLPLRAKSSLRSSPYPSFARSPRPANGETRRPVMAFVD